MLAEIIDVRFEDSWLSLACVLVAKDVKVGAIKTFFDILEIIVE